MAWKSNIYILLQNHHQALYTTNRENYMENWGYNYIKIYKGMIKYIQIGEVYLIHVHKKGPNSNKSQITKLHIKVEENIAIN